MSDDGLVLVLGALEEPAPVRSEFVEALRARLHAELGFAVPATAPVAAAVGVPTAPPVRPPATPGRSPLDAVRAFLGSLRPATPRVAVLAALALLLIAGTVVAGILVLRAWQSTGPRGVQYTDDFTYAEVYRERGGFYSDLQLAPDGTAAYALRRPSWGDPAGADSDRAAAIVRFEITPGTWAAPKVVLPLEQLHDPAYWDPGTDLRNAVLVPAMNSFGDGLAVAPDGTLFVAVSAMAGWGTETARTLATSLVALGRDGSAQTVVTAGEIVAADVLGGHAETPDAIGVAASGPGWLWVRAETPVIEPPGTAYWLLEITDPNEDGDWSDRVVRSLVLPADVPQLEYGVYDRIYGAFVAEPSHDGLDRSRSVLLPILERDGAVAIYRVADPDGDGDATDPGETELVFSGERPIHRLFPVELIVAPRIVRDGGRTVIDELVAAGLSRETRVSRITSTGVVDVMRALPSRPDGLVATPDGAIHVAAQLADDAATPDPQGLRGSVYAILRLAPVPVSAGQATSSAAPAASPTASDAASSPAPTAASPAEQPLVPIAPVTAGVPRIAANLMATSGDREEIMVLGADGSGPSRLVPGQHNGSFCQSADGSKMGIWSDEEVPGEYHLYVANADGTGRTRVSDTMSGFICRFPSDAMLVYSSGDPERRLYRHEFATGDESLLGAGLAPLASSPDGSRVAVAAGPDGRALQVVDMTTGTLASLAGPFDDRIVAGWWSPDGGRIAVAVGPAGLVEMGASANVTIHVVDADGGEPRRLVDGHGKLPEVSWSPDGRWALVRIPTHDTNEVETAGNLWLVDSGGGLPREISDGDVIFAAWSPVDASRFAYATPAALFLAGPTWDARRIAEAPAGPPARWPAGPWAGWSPDGTHIGLGTVSSRVTVIDVSIGAFRVVFRDTDDTMLVDWKWLWEPPAAPTAATQSASQIAMLVSGDDGGQALLIDTDGGEPTPLVSSRYVESYCGSADGSLIAFRAQDEVPGEAYTYVATPGGDARKVSETPALVLCDFPAEALILYRPGDPLRRLWRLDLATGEETLAAEDATALAVSPDGRLVALASGSGGTTLRLLDVVAGSVRTLGGPFDQRVFDATWSPAGDRLAIGVGPFADWDTGISAAFEIDLVEPTSGAVRRLAEGNGRLPRIAWSADGQHLMLRTPTRETREGAMGSDLRLIDVLSGNGQAVGGGDVIFADWSPIDPGSFAYATPDALFVADLSGAVRRVAEPPGTPARWPPGGWGGWSPDGRFIGLALGREPWRVTIVEVATGTIRVLFTESAGAWLDGWGWWP